LSGRAMLSALGIPLWKVPRIVRDMRALMHEHIDEFELYPGVSEMLQQLRAHGATLAIVSSNSAENVQHILGPRNALLITHYSCGASMFGKALKLKSVLRASQLNPEAAIYIGDEIRDGEAARKMRMAFGAVGWGQHRLDVLRQQQPAEEFSTVEEITRKLARD
ncbi:MAG TPA: HAD hydrolase-like protein, partial [Candidatus Acidoferrum sp.]|nr:HAD hydrolase-like protein [Candidatus Acidoferrum sp.]